MNEKVLGFIKSVPVEPGQKVLEVGSMDVNGSPRQVIKDCDYTGVDFRKGKGVDVVMNAEDVDKHWSAGHFDVVLCCETLEHCQHWKCVMTAAWNVLKDGGVFCLTTPTIEKGRHNYPSDYWRWTIEDYSKMFAAQETIRIGDTGRAGIGVIVRKHTDSLDLSVSPTAVA